MNRYVNIAKFVIATILLLVVVVLAIAVFSLKKEKDRLALNLEVEMSNNYDAQQTITYNELKEYFAKEVKTLKEYGVKTKNIENIVNIEYRYSDTLLYRDTLIYVYDTIKLLKTAEFDLDGQCWSVSGYVDTANVYIKNVSVHDSIVLALYKEKRKCLFEKRKVKAIAISSCKGDTLHVYRNLKIK